MKKVFLSQPVDLIPFETLQKRTNLLKSNFNDIGYDIINSFEKVGNRISENDICNLVESQIDKIKTCDFVVADLSIPNFMYVGCIGEIIYAHILGKKVYVITGDTGNEQRLWLKYHVTKFFKTFEDVISFLN